MNTAVRQELFAVIESGNLFLLVELIKGGADVNARAADPNGDTPLLRAVATGDVEVVRLLLAAGANPNSAGKFAGFTPLMVALDKPEIFRELIAAGADVNARTFRRKGEDVFNGGGALHFAASANNAEAVRALIAAGVEVEAVDENGLAPLDLALKRGLPTEASVALVEAGAELTPERQRAMHSAASEPESYLTGDSGISKEAEEILRRTPKAIDFKNRPRPRFKLHVSGWFLIMAFLYYGFSRLWEAGFVLPFNIRVALPMVGIMFVWAAINFYFTWRDCDPNCPNCSFNIQNCTRNYCHDCGSEMHQGWCRKCQVGDLEKGLVPFLAPETQDRRTIDYCPYCGVWLDSGLRRRKWWQR